MKSQENSSRRTDEGWEPAQRAKQMSPAVLAARTAVSSPAATGRNFLSCVDYNCADHDEGAVRAPRYMGVD